MFRFLLYSFIYVSLKLPAYQIEFFFFFQFDVVVEQLCIVNENVICLLPIMSLFNMINLLEILLYKEMF